MKYLTKYNNSLQFGYFVSIIFMKMTNVMSTFLNLKPQISRTLFFHDSDHNDDRSLTVNKNIF